MIHNCNIMIFNKLATDGGCLSSVGISTFKKMKESKIAYWRNPITVMLQNAIKMAKHQIGRYGLVAKLIGVELHIPIGLTFFLLNGIRLRVISGLNDFPALVWQKICENIQP
jgi:hypothetical protein